MTMYMQIPSRHNRKVDSIPMTAKTAIKRMPILVAERFALTNRFDMGDREEEVEIATKLVRKEPTPARNSCLKKMLTEVGAITLLEFLELSKLREAERRLREHIVYELPGSLP